MPWIRVDDHYDEHPKFAQVGPLGIALWLTGLAYCNRNLTDGFIPWGTAHSLLSWEFLGSEPYVQGKGFKKYTISVTSGMSGEDVDSEFVIDLLVESGLWEIVERGYRVHDYPDYQPTRDQVESERAKKQAAGQAGGQASASARARTNGSASAQADDEADAVADDQAPAVAPAQAKSNPVPKPVPVPGPDTSPSGPRHLRVVGEAVPKPTAKQTPVGMLLDKIKARDPSLQVFGDQGFTGTKLKQNPDVDLNLVAEAYVSFRHGDWPGSKMLRESGALAWVIGDLGGYVAWRNAHRPSSRGPVDRTGVAN